MHQTDYDYPVVQPKDRFLLGKRKRRIKAIKALTVVPFDEGMSSRTLYMGRIPSTHLQRLTISKHVRPKRCNDWQNAPCFIMKKCICLHLKHLYKPWRKEKKRRKKHKASNSAPEFGIHKPIHRFLGRVCRALEREACPLQQIYGHAMAQLELRRRLGIASALLA